MSKFKYFIIDTVSDAVTGTNDEEMANFCAGSDYNFVIDVEEGVLMQTNGDRDPIVEDDRAPI